MLAAWIREERVALGDTTDGADAGDMYARQAPASAVRSSAYARRSPPSVRTEQSGMRPRVQARARAVGPRWMLVGALGGRPFPGNASRACLQRLARARA